MLPHRRARMGCNRDQGGIIARLGTPKNEPNIKVRPPPISVTIRTTAEMAVSAASSRCCLATRSRVRDFSSNACRWPSATAGGLEGDSSSAQLTEKRCTPLDGATFASGRPLDPDIMHSRQEAANRGAIASRGNSAAAPLFCRIIPLFGPLNSAVRQPRGI